MENTSKMTQPLVAAQVLPAAQPCEEPMDELQALLAPVPPQTVALPAQEGPQMQEVVAEGQHAPPAQDESSGSSTSDSWEEPEDEDRVHVEKGVRTSSLNYNPT